MSHLSYSARTSWRHDGDPTVYLHAHSGAMSVVTSLTPAQALALADELTTAAADSQPLRDGADSDT
jgi:hypothetical protein